MKILVSYRAIPNAPGFATGDCVVRELRAMGHEVQVHAKQYQSDRWVENDFVPTFYGVKFDLLLYLEMNDSDPQYTELRGLKCKKVYWTFDDEMRPQWSARFVAEMGFGRVFYASDRSVFRGRRNTSWLPYFVTPAAIAARQNNKTRQCTIVGSPFPERVRFVEELKTLGVPVEFISGVHQAKSLRIMAESMVTINNFPSGGSGLLVNRVWDALGVGSCLVTELQPGLSEFLCDGDRCGYVAYHNSRDCAEIVGDLLASGRWAAVARAGIEVGEKKNLAKHRLEKILEVIK